MEVSHRYTTIYTHAMNTLGAAVGLPNNLKVKHIVGSGPFFLCSGKHKVISVFDAKTGAARKELDIDTHESDPDVRDDVEYRVTNMKMVGDVLFTISSRNFPDRGKLQV